MRWGQLWVEGFFLLGEEWVDDSWIWEYWLNFFFVLLSFYQKPELQQNLLRLILLVLRTCRIYKKCEVLFLQTSGLGGQDGKITGKTLACGSAALSRSAVWTLLGHLLGAVGDKGPAYLALLCWKPLSSSWAVSDGCVHRCEFIGIHRPTGAVQACGKPWGPGGLTHLAGTSPVPRALEQPALQGHISQPTRYREMDNKADFSLDLQTELDITVWFAVSYNVL